MILTLTVKVNNQSVDDIVRIIDANPTVTWSFDHIDVVTVDDGSIASSTVVEQSFYEIRIGTSAVNHGEWNFVGDAELTGVVTSTDKFWVYDGTFLARGTSYYGQIRVQDTKGNVSGWVKFTMRFNVLPTISGAAISPSSPTLDDDLTVSYTFGDPDGDAESGTAIRWFNNGVHQREFDGRTTIDSSILAYDDQWFVDLIPSDGYEYGSRTTTTAVTVASTAPTASDVLVFPANPNENDILKAEYAFSGSLNVDESRFQWFVNDVHQTAFDNLQFARPDVSPGDVVKVRVQAHDGVTLGAAIESDNVTIAYSEFVVHDIRIDGDNNPLAVNSLRPTVTWDLHVPEGKEQAYVSIKIGTFAGADDIYSATLTQDEMLFSIPTSLLIKGRDYYISIAASDTQTFGRYSISHFRISGSHWQETVSNTTGWTIETSFHVDDATYSEDNFHVIRVQDGTRFGEIRIHQGGANGVRIAFMSEVLETSIITTSRDWNRLTISGKGDDCKIYLNGSIIIDATGDLTQASTSSKLELGLGSGALEVHYRTFYYSTAGDFHPGTSSEFNTYQFSNVIRFDESEVADIVGYFNEGEDYRVIALNPHDVNEGGSIHAITDLDKGVYPASTVTFSPVNRIRSSPDGRWSSFAHARGASAFLGHLIDNYDHELDFTDGVSTDPISNGWDLIQNMGDDSAFFGPTGLEIDTTG